MREWWEMGRQKKMPKGETGRSADADRIPRCSIKSWQVQSFLLDDPGNGRAVALLIPLPAANFSPSPFFLVPPSSSPFPFFVLWSSSDASSPWSASPLPSSLRFPLPPLPPPPALSLCRLTRKLLSYAVPPASYIRRLLHNALRHCFILFSPCRAS